MAANENNDMGTTNAGLSSVEDNGKTEDEIKKFVVIKQEATNNISYAKFVLSKRRVELMKFKNDNEKLKKEISELKSECATRKTQNSHLCDDIVEIRKIAEKRENVHNMLSKILHNTSCLRQEYNEILETMKIQTYFIANKLRENYKAQLEEHEASIKEHISENEINQQELKATQVIVEDEEKKLSAIREDINKNKEINANLICKNEDLENKLSEIIKENQMLELDYSNRLKKQDMLLSEINKQEMEYKNSVKQLEESLNSALAKLEVQKEENIDLDKTLVLYTKNNLELKNSLKTTEEINATLMLKSAHIQDIKLKMNEEFENLSGNLKMETATKIEELQTQEQLLFEIKQNNRELEQENEILKNDLDSKVKEIDVLEEEIKMLQSDDQSLVKKNEDKIQANEQLYSQKTAMEAKIEELKVKSQTFKEKHDTEMKLLENEISQIENEMKFLEDEIQLKIKEATGEMDSTKAQEDADIERYTREHDKLDKEQQQILERIKVQEEEFSKINEYEQELKVLIKNCDNLSKEIKTMKTKPLQTAWEDVDENPISPVAVPSYQSEFSLPQFPRKRAFDEFSDSSAEFPHIDVADLKKLYFKQKKTAVKKYSKKSNLNRQSLETLKFE